MPPVAENLEPIKAGETVYRCVSGSVKPVKVKSVGPTYALVELASGDSKQVLRVYLSKTPKGSIDRMLRYCSEERDRVSAQAAKKAKLYADEIAELDDQLQKLKALKEKLGDAPKEKPKKGKR